MILETCFLYSCSSRAVYFTSNQDSEWEIEKGWPSTEVFNRIGPGWSNLPYFFGWRQISTKTKFNRIFGLQPKLLIWNSKWIKKVSVEAETFGWGLFDSWIVFLPFQKRKWVIVLIIIRKRLFKLRDEKIWKIIRKFSIFHPKNPDLPRFKFKFWQALNFAQLLVNCIW